MKANAAVSLGQHIIPLCGKNLRVHQPGRCFACEVIAGWAVLAKVSTRAARGWRLVVAADGVRVVLRARLAKGGKPCWGYDYRSLLAKARFAFGIEASDETPLSASETYVLLVLRLVGTFAALTRTQRMALEDAVLEGSVTLE